MLHLSSLSGSEDSLNLTHIHTGNILMCDDICRVAGFENTILGYPPRKSELFEESLNKINFHMLGESTQSVHIFIYHVVDVLSFHKLQVNTLSTLCHLPAML